METEVGSQRLQAVINFLNFLRGMETTERYSRRAWAERFLNFLRGMETMDALARYDRDSHLPKLP